jgi:hypothetical protein
MISKFRGRNFFKGVECNIPPVSIGILPFDRTRGLMLWKESLMETFINGINQVRVKNQCQVKRGLNEGHLSILAQGSI